MAKADSFSTYLTKINKALKAGTATEHRRMNEHEVNSNNDRNLNGRFPLAVDDEVKIEQIASLISLGRTHYPMSLMKRLSSWSMEKMTSEFGSKPCVLRKDKFVFTHVL